VLGVSPLRWYFTIRNEGKNGRLFSRIEKYDFDTVLWHQPDRAAKETAPRLKDSGVQVIGLSDIWFPSIRCRYEVQRESAIMSILRDWRANDAITSVIVVRGIEISAAKPGPGSFLRALYSMAFRSRLSALGSER
jgi:hypothetical protein